MSKGFSIPYAERGSGQIHMEQVFADRFLRWAYNNPLGWWVTRLVVSRRCVSRAYGWWNKGSRSRRRIRRFVADFGLSLNELSRPLEEYASFSTFVTREIDLSRRPIAADSRVCIAPADGKVLAYQRVEPGRTFRIKRGLFNLRAFLKDDELAEYFAHGAMVISRLCLADYHHFHFPDAGVPAQAVAIRGRYHAVGPYPQRRLLPFYQENHRMITLFDSEHFGRMALIEVGALGVGSIRQRYWPGEPVVKGARKGFFEMGGSTIVMLFPRGACEVDRDLAENTQRDLETYVRMGDSVGRVPAPRRGRAEQ